MENLISWFEIPAGDFGRAVNFYKAILPVDIKETEIFGTKVGYFAMFTDTEGNKLAIHPRN